MRILKSMVAALAFAAFASTAHAQVTEANFELDTAADLAALCGVSASDPEAVAAIHMCHGYVTGLIHFHILMGRALEGSIYCFDDEARPTRNQVIAGFVDWTDRHPDLESLEAADGMLHWAVETYPCE
jgi:hypothetical protein